MLTTQITGTTQFTPKRFKQPLYAVHELVGLGEHEFIFFHGKVVQRLRNGFRAELGRDQWSRIYKSPLKAILAI